MSVDLADVDDERRADVLLDHLRADRDRHAYEQRRPRSFTPKEGLIALHFEATLVMVAAGNLAEGVDLSDEDRHRLGIAVARITAVLDEAIR